MSRVAYSFKYCLVDHFATRFFISRFFRHDLQRFVDQSLALIYLRIMTKECRRRICRFSHVGLSEIRLMRFFCRGEIRRGKISVWCIEISREKYFCRVQICSINFFCVILCYVKVEEISNWNIFSIFDSSNKIYRDEFKFFELKELSDNKYRII